MLGSINIRHCSFTILLMQTQFGKDGILTIVSAEAGKVNFYATGEIINWFAVIMRKPVWFAIPSSISVDYDEDHNAILHFSVSLRSSLVNPYKFLRSIRGKLIRAIHAAREYEDEIIERTNP